LFLPSVSWPRAAIALAVAKRDARLMVKTGLIFFITQIHALAVLTIKGKFDKRVSHG
jgi:hypothetical protein